MGTIAWDISRNWDLKSDNIIDTEMKFFPLWPYLLKSTTIFHNNKVSPALKFI